MKESTTYQAILEEGEEKGKREGALLEARRMVRLQGEDLFGVPDARSAARIEGIPEVAQLEQLLLRLPRCHSWDELLEGVPSRRSARRQR